MSGSASTNLQAIRRIPIDNSSQSFWMKKRRKEISCSVSWSIMRKISSTIYLQKMIWHSQKSSNACLSSTIQISPPTRHFLQPKGRWFRPLRQSPRSVHGVASTTQLHLEDTPGTTVSSSSKPKKKGKECIPSRAIQVMKTKPMPLSWNHQGQ